MEYFSQEHNIPCYSVSMRGHGGSWYPWYLRMYFTGKRSFAEDVVAGIKVVERKEGGEVVLVAHSAGGGIAQYALSEGIGDLRARALVLMGAIPGFGSYASAYLVAVNVVLSLTYLL